MNFENNITLEQKHNSIPIYIIESKKLPKAISNDPLAMQWILSNQYEAKPGKYLIIPDAKGKIISVLIGKEKESSPYNGLSMYLLPKILPAGLYYFANNKEKLSLAAYSWLMSNYNTSSISKSESNVRLNVDDPLLRDDVCNIASGCALAIDMINQPANVMNPEKMSSEIFKISEKFNANTKEIVGDELLKHNFPLIHAVGRAGEYEPRIIDMKWGDSNHPKITLVGKAVTFDTGGLNIKPGNAMSIMKKDMGGGANILGLAYMIMHANLKINLRVIIPIVENNISSNSFRPGDILTSRNGKTIEIGNTDAEGRLILADALALGDEDSPEIMIDMATLTGAARVALGPELPPFYTKNKIMANDLMEISLEEEDPIWHMPYWEPYNNWLNEDLADINNAPAKPFAGSIIAAEFLKRFVKKTNTYMHFDIYAWNPGSHRFSSKGGAAQGIRTLFSFLKKNYN